MNGLRAAGSYKQLDGGHHTGSRRFFFLLKKNVPDFGTFLFQQEHYRVSPWIIELQFPVQHHYPFQFYFIF